MTKEKEYICRFKKTVYGVSSVYAKSFEEAQIKFETENVDDEFDTKSEYEWMGEVKLK